ncbi:hypothetical protein DNM18_27180 [Salmonella enterica subsp. enterica]|uniref:Uncharacterized protein n=1 Tax=Salmonella enterica subsp. diarizonae serovar Rough:r:z TaxID=1974321 RepID=A0A7Z0Y126_SALDZ|nr:hypothetical protein [Salmonella enterica subsp. enterica serovar Poona]EAM2984615.1 hypothetical protein [Salmonella enterica]EBS2356483.1 hypothetical protein [Salmonella enterica subsp. enterica serovar Muenchen]EBV2375279.1 hypothetical protein [Salmonella enterica subsp. enterica serovar Enteritidis]OSG79777.1 hypothetical protein R545_25525 [Salmonella enterica subsp. diarizonae serovar Rough:r:z]
MIRITGYPGDDRRARQRLNREACESLIRSIKSLLRIFRFTRSGETGKGKAASHAVQEGVTAEINGAALFPGSRSENGGTFAGLINERMVLLHQQTGRKRRAGVEINVM